jgi:phosphinothricin acetyltransferase
MEIEIRNYKQSDWDAVRSIYIQGMKTGNATFELLVPERDEWEIRHIELCRLVAVLEGETVGWTALSSVSPREAYAGVMEVSVYVSQSHSGRGIGKKLLLRVIEESEAGGIWTLQSSIFPENTASIRLHKSCGFKLVGTREKIGMLNGKWRDTVIFERRSKKII